MHRMSFLREQYMHRCILSPFSEMLHAKAVGTAPSGNATIVCLERESHVFADDNQTILEIARTPQRRETDVIIELRSKDAMLPVTQDHRVPGCGRADGVSRDIEAEDLRKGDCVFVNRRPTQLTSCRITVVKKAVVLQITFRPDKYFPPCLTKGCHQCIRIRKAV